MSLMPKKIFAACGSGVASSTAVAERLKQLIKQRKLDAVVEVVDFKRLKSIAKQADLIVNIAPYDTTDYGVPVVNGVPFMTGVGMEEAMDEIERIIKGTE